MEEVGGGLEVGIGGEMYEEVGGEVEVVGEMGGEMRKRRIRRRMG